MFIIYLVYVTPQFISVVSCKLDLGLNLVNTGNPFLHMNDVVYPKKLFFEKTSASSEEAISVCCCHYNILN